MQPVFGLLEDGRVGVLHHLGGDFLAPDHGQAMQDECRGLGMRVQLGVDLVTLERRLAGRLFGFKAHRGPDIGIDGIGPVAGSGWIVRALKFTTGCGDT